MKIKIRQFLTQTIIILSLTMLAFTGELGINTTRYCLFLILGLSFVMLCFLRIRIAQVIALTIILLSCIISQMIYGGNLANTLIFFSSVTFAITLFLQGIDTVSWKLLKTCAMIASVWFILQYLFGSALDSRERLIFFYENPNMAGIALCAPSMVLVLMAVEEKRKPWRMLYIAILLVMIYMVYITNNRGSFLALVAFIILTALAIGKTKQIRITKDWVYAILKLMPIVAMLVYVFLHSVLPDNLELLGKPFFTGREYAWRLALRQLSRNPFARYSFPDGTLNLFLEGVCRYGIFSMLGYFWILFTLRKPNLQNVSIRSYLAYLGFHLLLFQQSFESTLITGSYSVYIWTYLLLGVASMKEPGQPENRQTVCPYQS